MKIFVFAISLVLTTNIYAQSSIDTLNSEVELKELVVKADKIINKADRKMYIPDGEQIKGSINGTDLLRKLNIPALIVNPVDESITLASRGKIDLRINGRAVNSAEIKAIDPSTVLRVEYHDNPSLRYGEAEVVIDIIVKSHTSGGRYSTTLTQGLNKGYNDNFNNLKLNYKKSEFSFYNNFQSRWDLGQWRNNTEYYKQLDGTMYERVEDGIPADTEHFMDYVALGYCFTDPDKQMLWAQIGIDWGKENHNDYKGFLTNSESKDRVKMNDLNSLTHCNATLDIYYQRNLKNNQLLMFNVVGSVAPSRSNRTYQEYPLIVENVYDDVPAVDINTSVKGKSYDVLTDMVYERIFPKSRFTAGLCVENTWSESKYKEQNEKIENNQGKYYIYGEYWQRISNKTDITLGLGMSYYKNKIEDIKNSSVIFRPRLSFRYRPSKTSTFRLNMNARGNSPTISQLSNINQQVDNTQISVGNASLNNFVSYTSSVQYEYVKGAFYGSLKGYHVYSHNPIMEYKYWNDNYIVSSYANHKNSHRIMCEANLAINNLANWVSASLNMGFNRYIMHGNDYTHTYNNPFFNIQCEVSHWNWSVAAEIYSNRNSFYGESLSGGGESMHLLAVIYKYKKAQFMLACLNPFTNNYKVESENRNQYAGYKRTSYLKATQQLFAIGVKWNISWGRKHNSGTKRLNNSVNSETVKAVGKG